MALLQRCLPQCTSSTVVALTSDVSVGRSSSVQITTKSRPTSICRASSKSDGRGGVFADEECALTSMVFKDESNGIVCYYNENGEITCEGWDEGPHFQPEPQQYMTRRRRNTPRAMQARGSAEAAGFKFIARRSQLREGKADESYKCSEL